MKTALITSTGAVAADISLKSLKRMGFRTIGFNIYPREWIVESCDVDVFYQSPPVADQQKYLCFIKEICQKEKINYVLPMIDYEIDLLNLNREWFEERGIVLCMSPKDSIDIIRNKKRLSDFVEKECPQTTSIPTAMLCDIQKLEWKFPVVCKPYNGRSSQGLKYIFSQEEFDEFRLTVDQNTYIVEPFIEGPLVMVEVIRQADPHKVIAMTRRELIATPHGCSTTVYLYQDMELDEASKTLAEKLNVLGDVNFEYILDKSGVYHLVECNPRFSAGCEFSCMGGYDYVENHMRCFTGEAIENAHFKHNMIIARKYEEYITAVNVDVEYRNTSH